jgi:hypothetical protein
LIDVGVPAAEAGKGQSDVRVLPDEMGKPRSLGGEAVRRRGAVIGLLHLIRKIADQLGPRRPPLPIGLADRVGAGIDGRRRG